MASSHQPHEWTPFEIHTMLCLVFRGKHIVENHKRNVSESSAIRKAHMEFVTCFNSAMNRDNYRNDIPRREIIAKLEELLQHRKDLTGGKGLVGRVHSGRITRQLRMAFNRGSANAPSFDQTEWNERKQQMRSDKAIINETRARDARSDINDSVTPKDTDTEKFWHQADRGAAESNRRHDWASSSRAETVAHDDSPQSYAVRNHRQVDQHPDSFHDSFAGYTGPSGLTADTTSSSYKSSSANSKYTDNSYIQTVYDTSTGPALFNPDAGKEQRNFNTARATKLAAKKAYQTTPEVDSGGDIGMTEVREGEWM